MEHRCGEKGFTLIELLIAMFISMLVLGAAYTVFFGSSRAATMQTQDARMQDNARMAMDVLARDFYKMGFLLDFANYPAGTPVPVGGITAKLAPVNGPNADQVTIAGFPTGNPLDLQVTAGKGTNVLTLTAAGAGTFNPGDIVGIGLSDTALVSNKVGNNLILDTTNPSGLLNLDYPGIGIPGVQAGRVVRLTTVQYFIDWTDITHPVLMQQVGPAGGNAPQPVAEDIEDLQIAYGVDRDNNKIIDATEWIFDGVNAGPLTAADIDKIMLVRITLVARTSREDPSLRNMVRWVPAPPPAMIEDRAARNVTLDGYRRYQLTRIIKCKNVDKIVTL